MRGVTRLAGLCAGAAVAVAFGLVGASGAFAGQVLTLRTAGNGPLSNGAPLVATSTNAVLSTSLGGRVECEESVLAGSLNNNGAQGDDASFGSVSFGGDYENVPGACKFSVGGPATTEALALPWRLN